MKVASAGIALIAVGLALTVALEGMVGEALIVAGAVVMVYKLIQLADADGADRQSEMNARVDEIRARHQNPV